MFEMKSQRSVSLLPSQDDGIIAQDMGELIPISTFSNYIFHDPSATQLITPEPEQLIPCYLYQYSLLQMTCEQFQSLASICQTSPTISLFENCNSLTEYVPPEICNVVSSPFPADSGYDSQETIIAKPYVCEEFPILPQQISDSYPMVTNYGTVSILLRHLVRVDISPDNAVYVSIAPANCIAAINGVGNKSCIMHPNGRVFHDGNDIHMTTLNRKAKICKKGIIFTSADLCLSYLVDESGTKTTAERFRDLSQDFSFQVFYNDALIEDSIQECFKIVENVSYKKYNNGDEVWMIGKFRIKQDQWGDIKVTSHRDSRILKASPTDGQVTIKSKYIEISVGRYANNYLFVRKNTKLVTASARGFTVQNGTQKAGINSAGKVVLH